MSVAVIVKGWRNDEIASIYDAAANMDDYYFKDDLRPWEQPDFHRRRSKARRDRDRPAYNKMQRDYDNGLYGKNNQRCVMKAVQRHASRAPMPDRIKVMTPSDFDLCYDFLISKGKLLPRTENSLTGVEYHAMCIAELDRRDKARLASQRRV